MAQYTVTVGSKWYSNNKADGSEAERKERAFVVVGFASGRRFVRVEPLLKGRGFRSRNIRKDRFKPNATGYLPLLEVAK